MERIEGSYELMRKLRESQNWTAYLARDGRGNLRALKFFDMEKLAERRRVRLLQKGLDAEEADREAKAYADGYRELVLKSVDRVKGLGNDHVAATLGIAHDKKSGKFAIVSEYAPGVDLAYAAERLNPMQLVHLFAQALDGLRFIHGKGFLHLNIKPSRVWVDIEGDPPTARFTDFGFGVRKGGYDGECAGTLLYMAPEVVLESKDKIDERADLYSFGVTMYACLTGRIPLEGRLAAQADSEEMARVVDREESVKTPPSFYNGRVPKELDEIVLGLLVKEPERRRYGSAGDLLEALRGEWPEECSRMPMEGRCELLPATR